jgi:hypothetical protein
MASLAEIRARLAASEGNKQGGQSSGGDNSIYPHWNMEEGSSATLRFLPDANSKNTFFKPKNSFYSKSSEFRCSCFNR